MVLDMARPTAALGTSIDNINILLPRDVLDVMLTSSRCTVWSCTAPPRSCCAASLVALVDNLPHLPSTSAPDIARATCSLVAACPGAISRCGGARPRTDRAGAARRDSPLHQSLSVLARSFTEMIGKALGLSRSTLYAACGPLRRRRRADPAAKARAHWSDPDVDPRDHRRISEIAYQHGFVSTSHFSRAFRGAFGLSPREAREGALRQPDAAAAESPGDAYET